MTSQPVPIVCDMTTATDTTEERLDLYRHVFRRLTGRERTETGIRFRLRAGDGLADVVRDLADREKACCAFFDFDIREAGDEIIWDATVVDDPIARQILDEYYVLPDTLSEGTEALFDRFAAKGLAVVIDDGDGGTRPATHAELGITRSSSAS